MQHAHSPEASTENISEAERWHSADQAEIDAVRALGTWEVGGCDLPVGKRALPTHILREIKRDGRYKSRLVAQGD
jgi:hypothetical protein